VRPAVEQDDDKMKSIMLSSLDGIFSVQKVVAPRQRSVSNLNHSIGKERKLTEMSHATYTTYRGISRDELSV
jgi:hypothetical protein